MVSRLRVLDGRELSIDFTAVPVSEPTALPLGAGALTPGTQHTSSRETPCLWSKLARLFTEGPAGGLGRIQCSCWCSVCTSILFGACDITRSPVPARDSGAFLVSVSSHTHLHTHTHMGTCIRTHISVCWTHPHSSHTYTCMHVSVCARSHMCTYTLTYARMH